MKKKPRPKVLPYQDGTWFAVPLLRGGYAIGRVARFNATGQMLAYFFGPKRVSIPVVSDLYDLTPGDSIKTILVADVTLINGRWPIIGESGKWKREDWPIPYFIHRNEMLMIAFRVTYTDDGMLEEGSREPIPYDTLGYEHDSLRGFLSVEKNLTQILDHVE